MRVWVLFGTSNQLLAALTLLGVTVWLRSEKRRTWFVAGPMCFVFAITFWALGVQILNGTDAVLRITAGVLLLLGLYVGAEALLRKRAPVTHLPEAAA